MRAFITGLAGPVLTVEERQFLKDAEPWGLIVFKRNITEPEALRRLIDDVRDALGRVAPVLIDQEGGRVQRLGPPHWPAYPPGAAYLAALGIDVDCLPIADVPVPGADPIVGDRAYGTEPGKVAAIAGAIAA